MNSLQMTPIRTKRFGFVRKIREALNRKFSILTTGLMLKRERSVSQSTYFDALSEKKSKLQPEHDLCYRSRRSARRYSRLLFSTLAITFTLLLFLTGSVWNGVVSRSYSHLPHRYISLKHKVESSSSPGRGNINNEKVFIAANIVNEEMIRGAWGNNLVSLIDLLGKENVFVSIYENDGGNATYSALQALRQRLPCNSSVVAGEHVPLSDLPTTRLPDGQERVQRLTYLAEIRNRLLRPLNPFYHENSANGFRKVDNVRFDRILFLNDVYYSPLDAVQLLFSTNANSGRAQYRAACAIDFVQMFKLYDTFVVRDTEGYQVSLQFFPWFTTRGTGISRKDVLSLSDAVRVKSCWGGMAAFDASVFQPPPEAGVDNTPPNNGTGLQIKFRSNGETFWEAAECCLIFADLEARSGPSIGDDSGVFVNPYIRTAYSETTWKWLPFWRRFEHIFEYYQRVVDFVLPPEWNQRRTHEPGQMVDELVWNKNSRSPSLPANPHYRNEVMTQQAGRFEITHRAATPGGFCGERRMFVMKKDVEAANKSGSGKNWEKIKVPWHQDLERP